MTAPIVTSATASTPSVKAKERARRTARRRRLTVAQAGALPDQSLGSAGSNSSTHAASSNSSANPPAPASTKATKKNSATTTTKQYTGQAITTRYGVVQVKVTVSGAKITNVGFAQLTAFDGRSQQINSYAAPQLLRETLSAQSAHVDTISGATYTSAGYIQSLQSALDKR